MSKTIASKPSKGNAILMTTMVLVSTLSVLIALCPSVLAAADTVTLADAQNNPYTAVKAGTVVYIRATDGATTGGQKSAIVKENGQANQITVTMYDDGALMGDTAADGNYLGMFNVTDKNDGGVTNDGTDTIAVPDVAGITATVDLDGDASSGNDVITADFTNPVVTITSADKPILSGNYYLKVQSTDANLRNVTYQVDGGDMYPTQPSGANLFLATVDTDALSEDMHEIMVTSRDNATNENYDWVNITVDRTDPDVIIRPSSKFISESFFLNVTVQDTNLNESTVLYRLDTESQVLLPKVTADTFTTTIDLSGKNEGLHTVFISASDMADNTNNTQNVKFTLDRTKSTITVNSVPGSVVSGTFLFNISVTDDNIAKNEIKYKLDGGLPLTIPDRGYGFFEATINTVPFTEGAHNIVVTVKDMANNVNDTSASPFTFIVDRTQPNITVTSVPMGYYKDTYTLTVEVIDANIDNTRVLYLVDGANQLPLPYSGSGNVFTKTIDVSGWSEKSYALTVKAQDKANNIREVGGVTVVVDRTPPSFSYTLKPSGTDYRLEAIVSDPNLAPDTVFYSLDGGAKKEFDNIVSNSYSAIVSKSAWGEGNHTIKLYGGDKAGNSKEQTFTEILMDPPAPLTGLNAQDLFDGKIKLTWTASAVTDLDHYNIYYRPYDIITDVSGINPSLTSTTNSVEITSLVIGTRYYFAVTAVDTHGYENKSVQPTTATPKESVKMPSVNITSITASKTEKVKAGDTITFTIIVKNTGLLNATNLKVRLLIDDNDMGTDTIAFLGPGETETKTFDWNAEEGDHNVSALVLLGVQSLDKKPLSGNPIKVGKEGNTTTETSWFNPYYILIIVGAIIGIGVMVGIWRMTKKQDEEIKQQEIELGLRPDKDGKIHKPEGMGPKPGEPKPVTPAKPSHSPDVYIPSSPLLQQQPPAQQPPVEQPPAAPPQQQQYQQPPPQQ